MQPTDLWHEVKGADRAARLKSTVDSLATWQTSRINRALRNIRLYEGLALGNLSPGAYMSSGLTDYVFDDADQMRVNLARSIVNTAVAKVAGKQRPKAQFCVSDGDWTEKRRAKQMEKAVEAVMLSRQGSLHDGYEVGILALRDACVCDCGVIGFSADHEEKRVVIERIPPWEIVVDPNEARNGQPLNMFRVRPYDKHKLAAQFPKYAADIMAAPTISPDDPFVAQTTSLQSTDRQVKVYEGIRRPCGKDKKGAHAVVVGNVDITGGEDWTRRTFPWLFLVWEPWMLGPFGTSLVDNVRDLAREFNAAFERWATAELKCSNVYIDVEEGQCSKDQLEDNAPAVIIERKPGTPPVNIVAPNTMGPASIEWLQILKSLNFEVPGVGQQAATGQKAPGVDAAVAMRTVQDIETERFAIQWQQFERVMAIGGTRQVVECLNELAENGDFPIRVSRNGALTQINWKKDAAIDLPDEAVQVYAVSGLVNTPADRLNLAETLRNGGVIGNDAYLRVIQAKDIDAELGRGNQQSALVERLIERWLDTDPADAEANVKACRPPSSLKWMNLEEAIVQVGRAYMQAELDECPDANLDYFLRFLTAADAELQKRQQAQAQLQAMARGGAPAVPPGAPPVPGAGPEGAVAA